MLDLTPLSKALEQLRTSIQYSQSELAANDGAIAKQFRAASIQAFEFTFEISVRMLRRRLADMLSAAEVEQLSFRDLLRTGAQKGLIDDPAVWFRFREMRNLSSHSYDESKAAQIAATLPEFAEKAGFLLDALRKGTA
jgi:nucleotidyltransferase substrate binding protein (TIGR01987 family)